ncbi:hypothetical protein JW905_13150 [bacterium]|nr:hypothetical protein [candidate division CSSED10-310 bacterium]
MMSSVRSTPPVWWNGLRLARFIAALLLPAAAVLAERPTLIDGQYYLRGVCPDGNAYCGTGFDAGSILRQQPEEKGERNCACWVQFAFREPGVFPSDTAQTITKIYYHVWWRTNDPVGILGYDSQGNMGSGMDECFHVHTLAAVDEVDSYRLTIHEQVVSQSYGVFWGEEIHQFTIKLKSSDCRNPSILSTPEKASFIILNPELPEVLAERDTDCDGLNDRDELYVYFTDPANPDTDDDTYGDFYETVVRSDMDPNDHQDAPCFGRSILATTRGGQAGGLLGQAMIILDDMDGDGFNEVAVGEPGAECVRIMDGKLNTFLRIDLAELSVEPREPPVIRLAGLRDITGRVMVLAVGLPEAEQGDGIVYLFDLSGNLLYVLASPCTAGRFGGCLAAVPDMNDDGWEDLAAGAPALDDAAVTGSVFVYSGLTFEQLAVLPGFTPGDRFGAAITGVPGSDGGLDALLVGAPSDDTEGRNAGSVYLLDPDGHLLQHWPGIERFQLGHALCLIGDQDGDGHADFAFSAPSDNALYWRNRGVPMAGRVLIHSGTTHACIRTLSLESPGDFLGDMIVPVADLDGDGLDDLAATTRRWRYRGASLAILSAQNTLLWRFTRNDRSDALGSVLLLIDDRNGDDEADFLLGSPEYLGTNGIQDAGAVMLVTRQGGILASGAASPTFDPALYFNDPDGDVITYQVIPLAGGDPLDWNAAGGIRWRDQEIVIQATDPFGAVATSNVFLLPTGVTGRGLAY